ncbi:hypothetical protein Q5530_29590 [Saccharothrix sp. BKS2]|uniref:hypothetical protein n=1 Tax=Saccharothrix sp. BKS2 TaxID=3064400 RepID=UPI0039E8FB57
MGAADRVLLIDVDGVVGPDAPRPELVRARVAAVLRAAGPVHHALACYTGAGPGPDLVGSALTELGVPSRAVPPGRGAVAAALLAHARYAHGRGAGPSRWPRTTAPRRSASTWSTGPVAAPSSGRRARRWARRSGGFWVKGSRVRLESTCASPLDGGPARCGPRPARNRPLTVMRPSS